MNDVLKYEIAISFLGRECRMPGLADERVARKLAQIVKEVYPECLVELCYDGLRHSI